MEALWPARCPESPGWFARLLAPEIFLLGSPRMHKEKMFIVLVEDTERHVESALRQFAGNKFGVCRTATEAEDLLRAIAEGMIEAPDLILSDMFVRVGIGLGSQDTDRLILAGLAVAAAAGQLGVPCLVLTDGGGDHHPLCRMLAPLLEKGSDSLAVRSVPVLGESDGKNWALALRSWPEAPLPVRVLAETALP